MKLFIGLTLILAACLPSVTLKAAAAADVVGGENISSALPAKAVKEKPEEWLLHMYCSNQLKAEVRGQGPSIGSSQKEEDPERAVSPTPLSTFEQVRIHFPDEEKKQFGRLIILKYWENHLSIFFIEKQPGAGKQRESSDVHAFLCDLETATFLMTGVLSDHPALSFPYERKKLNPIFCEELLGRPFFSRYETLKLGGKEIDKTIAFQATNVEVSFDTREKPQKAEAATLYPLPFPRQEKSAPSYCLHLRGQDQKEYAILLNAQKGAEARLFLGLARTDMPFVQLPRSLATLHDTFVLTFFSLESKRIEALLKPGTEEEEALAEKEALSRQKRREKETFEERQAVARRQSQEKEKTGLRMRKYL